MIRPTVLVAMTVSLMATLIAGPATAQVPVAAPTIAPTVVPAVLLQCGYPSTNTFGFTPWLTLAPTPTTIQRTTAYRKCSAPMVPNIRSGYETKTNNIMDHCAFMIGTGGSATFAIVWNTTQQTTFVASRTTSLTATTFTISYSGTVTAGLFLGRNVRQVFTADATEIHRCLAGLQALPFVISDVTLTIF